MQPKFTTWIEAKRNQIEKISQGKPHAIEDAMLDAVTEHYV
jgi:hypothetical protein